MKKGRLISAAKRARILFAVMAMCSLSFVQVSVQASIINEGTNNTVDAGNAKNINIIGTENTIKQKGMTDEKTDNSTVIGIKNYLENEGNIFGYDNEVHRTNEPAKS